MDSEIDSRSVFIEDNLNGYNLPAENLFDIREILMKRYGAKFSDGLSPEGRLAMEQASIIESESPSAKCLNGIKQSQGNTQVGSNRKINKNEKKTKNITFTKSKDKASSEKQAEDDSDEHFKQRDMTSQDGDCNTANVTETIEKETNEKVDANLGVIDNANLQSVEKCLLWIEVNNKTQNMHDSEHRS